MAAAWGGRCLLAAVRRSGAAPRLRPPAGEGGTGGVRGAGPRAEGAAGLLRLGPDGRACPELRSALCVLWRCGGSVSHEQRPSLSAGAGRGRSAESEQAPARQRGSSAHSAR